MTSEPHIFLVILTDINNNAPIITTTEFNTRENVKEVILSIHNNICNKHCSYLMILYLLIGRSNW